MPKRKKKSTQKTKVAERQSIEELIKQIQENELFQSRIVHVEKINGKSPVYATPEPSLPVVLSNYLVENSIQLYSHQVDVLNNIRKGNSVIITTSTASGKTLSFNIPIFEQLLTDQNSTSLYLYPAKALSNDQLKNLVSLEKFLNIDINPQIYDGDTPKGERKNIRNNSRIILRNPYMLHRIIPWHKIWKDFLSNLKFIVVDEAHEYRGIFGSNIAMLIRRLRRICTYYNSEPQFILATATLANPKDFSENLVGLPFEIVNNDGSPVTDKYISFYNPFFDGDYKARSMHRETANYVRNLVSLNIQTLCFTVSRKMCELVSRWVINNDEILENKVSPYRAGYTPQERREIENKFKNKELMCIVSTKALELGIDIGTLDSVVISGYPGTMIAFWQQAGRSGRRENEAFITFIAFDNLLDQYFKIS
jgi:DEAD/DEAH box helicase domain-containing protein